MSKQFCEICLQDRRFKRVELEEEVTIKDKTFNVIHEYDQCENCGELFEPIEDIDKNIKLDYRTYREKVGFLQPEEIKQIREKYGLNFRQYAELLGVGHSTLWHIENGSLQNEYQNTLFLFAESPSAMYKLVLDKKEFLSFEVDETIDILQKLCMHEEPHLTEFKTDINQKVTYMTQKINSLEFDIYQLLDSSKLKETKKEEKEKRWTRTFQYMILQH